MARYIEKDALVEHLNERRAFLFKENGEYDHYSNGFDEAVCKVEDFSPVDAAQVKHGEWQTVPNREFDGFETVVRGEAERCTNCCRASKDFKKWFERCPNCGAKMDGGGGDD